MRSAECGVQLLGTEIFRQCKGTALQKSHPPVANRQSPFAVVFGSAGTSPSQFIPSLVPRPTPRFLVGGYENEAC